MIMPESAVGHSGLEKALQQYDIVKRIATFSTAADLSRVARTSRTAYAEIRGREESWKNLITRTHCSGVGTGLRIETIDASLAAGSTPDRHPETWREDLKQGCGANYSQSTISKPCDACGIMVCNECRTHTSYSTLLSMEHGDYRGGLVFNSQYITLSALLEQPDAKSIMLSTPEMLEHDINATAVVHPWFFRQSDQSYQPTYRKDWVNDLVPLELGTMETFRNNFRTIIGLRKRYCCVECASARRGHKKLGKVVMDAVKSGAGTPTGEVCRCTLRKRLLDRWICLPCIIDEIQDDEAYATLHPCIETPDAQNRKLSYQGKCPCGTRYDGMKNVCSFCSWCGGRVIARKYNDNGTLYVN
ncbi:hypothetical protein BDV96DRAFT_218375 [Lophiotrema nucula]|uniref:Uncharacterized protein n=1 Tax=Lophiotrema nucula TaxID=690887 RepID=A0A6A5ZRC7_9PLEO|nr:hypothetical protein BDV96DRAFT_218375 [Lophiotrema nucula]